MERDPADAMAEFMAEFRSDLESFVSIEIVRACTDNVRERLPQLSHTYTAFVDPSGGSSDSMTLAIAHLEGKTAVVDAMREVRAAVCSQRRGGGLCRAAASLSGVDGSRRPLWRRVAARGCSRRTAFQLRAERS